MTILTGRRARRALTRRLRNPLALLRTARAGGVVTLLRAAMVVPGAVRRPVLHPFAAVLEGLARRRAVASVTAPLAFVAIWGAERGERARALTRQLGTDRQVAPAARRRLATLAFAAGLKDATGDVVASLADDPSADLIGLRSRLAFDEGRYTEALHYAQAAFAEGVPGAPVLMERAESFVNVLRPGWVPDLGPALPALATGRHEAVPGRVLHLVAVSLPYRQAGYTIRTQSVARCQAAEGLDPHVMTRAGFPRSEGVANVPALEVVDGIPHHRVAPGFADDERPDRLVTATARAAVPLIEALRPAVLQPATNHYQAQVALALSGAFGTPFVYEVRGFWEETWLAGPTRADEATAMQAERYRLTRDVETSAMLAADAVVTLSETMRQEIIGRGCAPDRVAVVPNAVDLDQFTPVPRNDALGSSLGLEPSDYVVGYVSTFTRYEGVSYLLEAAASLRARGRRIKVLLVGDGADLDHIVETARRLGLDDGTAVMPGRVPHGRILDYYSLIDVFVVPRTADRVSRMVTPLKPYEAMALARTLVVSDLPALREIVTHGETGLTFRAEDAEDLARVLADLQDDPALRTALGRRAREWVAAERTWAQNGRRYRELFERLGVA